MLMLMLMLMLNIEKGADLNSLREDKKKSIKTNLEVTNSTPRSTFNRSFKCMEYSTYFRFHVLESICNIIIVAFQPGANFS